MHYLEEELREKLLVNEQMFTFLDDFILDGIWYWDLENQENQWVSPGFWRTLGVDPAEKQHNPAEWMELLAADDLQLLLKNLTLHSDDPGHAFEQILTFTTRDRGTIWVRCKGLAIRRDDGYPRRLFAVHFDISQEVESRNRYKQTTENLDRVYADVRLALEESEQLLASMPDAIIHVDQDGFIARSNSAAHKLFEYSEAELNKLRVEQLIPQEQRQAHVNNRLNYQRDPRVREMGGRSTTLMGLKKSGSTFYADIRLSPIVTRYGKYTLAVIRDITERKLYEQQVEEHSKNEERLRKLAQTDPLTGLYNRRHFFDLAGSVFKLARRSHRNLSLAMIDLDDFKQINDIYGHPVGDEVLKKLSGYIARSVRATDIFARYGGEEFIILLPDTGIDSAHLLMDKLQHNLNAMQPILTFNSEPITITMSIGLSALGRSHHNFDDLIESADQHLYAAKKQGKNCIVQYINNSETEG